MMLNEKCIICNKDINTAADEIPMLKVGDKICHWVCLSEKQYNSKFKQMLRDAMVCDKYGNIIEE